jgi:23S rRNA (adenine2503-C2)-methyltransferase
MTRTTAPADLLGLTPEELEAELGHFFEGRGQPRYRARQVAHWIFRGGVASFQDMTDLPVAERDALEAGYRLGEPTTVRVSESADGTAKHLWGLEDGELVESVLIPAEGRLTLCLSSQAGCAVGCTFCATGWSGFRRQLTAGEIVAQYRASARWSADRSLGPITNVVYMGMGEPLANRGPVMASLTILNRGYGVGARRITVSTVGVVPGILELARRPEQFRLAVSLHSPSSEPT